MSTSERRSLLEDKRRLLGSMRQSLGMKNPIAPFAQNPVTAADDGRNSFTKMTKRHKKDQDFIISNFKEHPETEFTPIYQTTFDDDRDPILEPTFSKHRIPLQIRCLERYHISKKEYAHQFKREIDLLIENQPTAESAWQFVRTMAYTTLWPPLHTRKELKMFEKDFCKLSPAEQRRYDKIMSINFT
ncbi:uncharacterized protein [Drosophila kikkawai]|uniref:Uncharacterized protein n=1 Tax=Drosophila kikkawai TaxID=30033 RepID=A0ABM4GL59_DROKI|nr:uncharacterized protein LOC108084103 [Drosophila kikkawai]